MYETMHVVLFGGFKILILYQSYPGNTHYSHGTYYNGKFNAFCGRGTRLCTLCFVTLSTHIFPYSNMAVKFVQAVHISMYLIWISALSFLLLFFRMLTSSFSFFSGGAGGRGTWGSLLETDGEACVDRNDPNYDSETVRLHAKHFIHLCSLFCHSLQGSFWR